MKLIRFLLAVPAVLLIWTFATLGLAFGLLTLPIGIGAFTIVGCIGMYGGSLVLAGKFVRGTK